MQKRIASLDVLRGMIMVVMALDHVRDFMTNVRFSPTDLSQTTPALFFTRWITHFCAPVFIFLAGTGAFFYGVKKNNPAQLSRFLWTRGLMLIIFEITIMNFGNTFNFHNTLIILLVLWVIGVCMIIMAALIHLPAKWIAAIGLLLIVGHNALDGIKATDFGSLRAVWMILHEPGVLTIFGKTNVVFAYSVIPWIGVMALGYTFGPIFQMEAARRQRILWLMGIATTLAFLLIRGINIYGDPAPWSSQKNALFTILSFLNTNKYPPSLCFLLMTLGPSFILLAILERGIGRISDFFITYGRVPLFYYILHFYLIHLLSLIVGTLQGFKASAFLQFVDAFPPSYGLNLWGVYTMWVLTVLIMYPLCKWYGNLKSRSNNILLTYI
ncbi:DUF1624 domain-containing protein [Chitinophaga eiseniae]|uniref:DUF1624 domain-containing protein n=1 Tax=Chitinophaga eiseniae TaxID=634771 RepID=A0A847SPZ4_9BACT|nr:heparan-alpha-glucosaminide N-acetyltransferase domain-containing protein [Chitinophaga eiseniae]NLR81037.1 DUF1624 domain-containing protein [Chitinophaga eiseniae]